MPSKSTYPIGEEDIRFLMETLGKINDRLAKLEGEFSEIKGDFSEVKGGFAGIKDEIRASEERIKQENKDYYNFYTGKIYKDFRGATDDQIQILKDKDDNHEVRISALEQKADYALAA